MTFFSLSSRISRSSHTEVDCLSQGLFPVRNLRSLRRYLSPEPVSRSRTGSLWAEAQVPPSRAWLQVTEIPNRRVKPSASGLHSRRLRGSRRVGLMRAQVLGNLGRARGKRGRAREKWDRHGRAGDAGPWKVSNGMRRPYFALCPFPGPVYGCLSQTL